MAIEYSGGNRGTGTFPKHWVGLTPGQDSDERAAMLIVNMALDLEARGDRRGAEELRQSFISGGGRTVRMSLEQAQQRWVENPTAVNALALARAVQ